MNGIDLSISVVNWNTRGLLEQCLDSIYANIHGLQFEVFVVDNASIDGSAEMVRERFPQVRLIENEVNVGFAKANNQAIRESRGRYILLLNSDTVVLPRAIGKMVEFMDEHSQTGAVGPMLLNPDGSFQSSYNDFPTLFSELITLVGLSRFVYSPYHPSYSPQQSKEVGEVDWVGGGCLLVRREAIDHVGLLDEDYFMYVEETDWCYRMNKLGWKVYYLPDVQIVHWGGQSANQQSERMFAQLFKSKFIFFRKHHGPISARTLRVAAPVTSFLKIGLWAIAYLIGGNDKRRMKAKQRVRSNLLVIREAKSWT